MCSATATSSHVARHEVVAEARPAGAKPMACRTPSTRPHLLGDRVADGVEVVGHGDVELEHVDVVAELAGRALGEAERPAGAGEHDLGALARARAWRRRRPARRR